MNATWNVEVFYAFPETKQVNKKGNIICIPILVRHMHIYGNFAVTNYYRVTLVKRLGEMIYSVKQKVKVVKPWWEKPDEYQMVKEGSYDREQFIAWLGKRVADPEGATLELETAPPVKKAA